MKSTRIPPVIVVVLAALAAVSLHPSSLVNGILAGLAAYLAFEILALRRRVAALEQQGSRTLPAVRSSPKLREIRSR